MTTGSGSRPDYTWLLAACDGEQTRLAEVALLLAAASIGEASLKHEGFFERMLHMRVVIESVYQALGREAPPRKVEGSLCDE